MADLFDITQNEVEEWRPVVGWEGLYEVSDFGRVRSLDRRDHAGKMRKGRLLSPTPDSWGYAKVPLSFGKTWIPKVHVLVATAFLGERPSGMTVNHKNGVKFDARLVNLEWISLQDNLRHSREILGNCHGYKPRGVIGIRGESKIEFASLADAQKCGFDRSHIRRSCLRAAMRHKGYKWAYIDG